MASEAVAPKTLVPLLPVSQDQGQRPCWLMAPSGGHYGREQDMATGGSGCRSREDPGSLDQLQSGPGDLVGTDLLSGAVQGAFLEMRTLLTENS